MTKLHSNSPVSWPTLAEFSLPGQPDIDQLAWDYVAAAMQPLNLSPADLDRVKTAISEAVLHGVEYGSRYRPNLPIQIRLQISNKPAALPISNPEDVSTPNPIAPDLAIKMPKQEPTQCWGFFLTERMVDVTQISGEDVYYYIELFLYPE